MSRLFVGLFLLVPSLVWGQAFTVENPQPGGTYSGIGALTGWRCTGNSITFVFDTGLIVNAGYGTNRNDTVGVCGDANNGFAALMNFNLLGDGQHTVSVRDNGVQFAFVTFNVKTLGAEFLTGRSGTYQLQNFPNAGQTTTVQWQQSSQNFVITNVTGGGGGGGGFPNVAGTYTSSLTIFEEDCNFLSVPPDLPTALGGTLTVNQNQGSLTVQSGSITMTGDLETNGDFVVVGPVEVRALGGGCNVGFVPGYAGNFGSGLLVFATVVGHVSGSCTPLSLPCTVAYAGSITPASSATARIAEEPTVALPTDIFPAMLDAMRR